MIELTEQVKYVSTREEDEYTRFMCPNCGATIMISKTEYLDSVKKPDVCGHCKEKLNYE